MENKTLYATNPRQNAVYKLEPPQPFNGRCSILTFTTAHGEECYNIEASEYLSFRRVFLDGSGRAISKLMYDKRRSELKEHLSHARCFKGT